MSGAVSPSSEGVYGVQRICETWAPRKIAEAGMLETLTSVAGQAYERRMGKPFEFDPVFSYETGSNPDGWRKPEPG